MIVKDPGGARPAAMRTPFLSVSILCLGSNCVQAQPPPPQCIQPLCVNRVDDRANLPLPGMLRYAVREAPPGSTITFDPALSGQTIKLDTTSPKNRIRITRDVILQGPG